MHGGIEVDPEEKNDGFQTSRGLGICRITGAVEIRWLSSGSSAVHGVIAVDPEEKNDGISNESLSGHL